LDTGKAGEFLENAKKLKKDIGAVQTIVLTHAQRSLRRLKFLL
jgi:metal-dependent hydrolase (beta-lactamase superfamily II)